MLSQKARYALHAALFLARKGGPAPIAEIAQAEGIPRKFLEHIMLVMKSRGITYSRRGASGGYELARPPERITFAEILRGVEGPLALAPCASRTAYAQCPDCKSVDACEIRPILVAVRDTTSQLLEGMTLAGAIASRPAKVDALFGVNRQAETIDQ